MPAGTPRAVDRAGPQENSTWYQKLGQQGGENPMSEPKEQVSMATDGSLEAERTEAPEKTRVCKGKDAFRSKQTSGLFELQTGVFPTEPVK